MTENEKNEPKRPLLEVIDESIRRVMMDARNEKRSVNKKQFEVLQNVCKILSDIIGGDARVSLYPVFSAGYITVKVPSVNFSTEKISGLKSILNQCTVLSAEPLTNGSVEIGVTIPDVFCPAEV